MTKGERNYHLLLSRPFDLDSFDQRAEADLGPRHTMSMLRHALDAKVHQPGSHSVSLIDKVHGAVFPRVGKVEQWALARHEATTVSSEDVVFAIGEDAGFPFAAKFPRNSPRPKIAVFMQYPVGRFVGYMFKFYNMRDRVDLFFTNTDFKERFLIENFGVPKEKVFLTEEQTDTEFFHPMDVSPGKTRPIIGSGGLEQRDYLTLAAAVDGLEIDVRVCAMSPNNHLKSGTFPEPLPDNMRVGEYDWPELRQLYNDSDIVVLSMKDNRYQAGLTTLMEAMACRRPVIMTRTEGLATRLADAGLITPVQPADPIGLRTAIQDMLSHPDKAAVQAERGYKAVLSDHTADRLVGDFSRLLVNL